MQLQFKSDAAAAQPAQNPFAQPAQAAPNPFAQQAQPAQNPFAQQAQPAPAPAPQPAQNPFQAQPVQNPFAVNTTGAAPVNPAAQVQAIRADVAAPPPPSPAEAFAAFGAALPPSSQPAAPNPFAQPAQAVVDAEVVETRPNITASPEDRQPPAQSDTGWQVPAARAAADAYMADKTVVATVAPASGVDYVPFNTIVPADKLADVMAAVARVLKK